MKFLKLPESLSVMRFEVPLYDLIGVLELDIVVKTIIVKMFKDPLKVRPESGCTLSHNFDFPPQFLHTPRNFHDDDAPQPETCPNNPQLSHKLPTMAESKSTEVPQNIVEQYDLLPKMIPYLDRHLVYPLVADRPDSEENKKLRFELLKTTTMFDFLADLDMDIRKTNTKSPEYAKKREETLAKGEQFQEDTQVLRDLLGDEAVVGNLRSDKVANLKYLETDHQVTVEMVDKLYEYGQWNYSCGNYGEAAELLYQFRVLVSGDRFRGIYTTNKYLYSPQTTRRFRQPHGASLPPKSSTHNGTRLWRR